MNSPSSEVRRCRPLLDTFVEITSNCKSAEKASRAIVEAFSTVERVQRLMSAHESNSEVTQLNRYAAQRNVKVSPWTHQVLLAAQRLHDATQGSFDVTVGIHVLLPKQDDSFSEQGGAVLWRTLNRSAIVLTDHFFSDSGL